VNFEETPPPLAAGAALLGSVQTHGTAAPSTRIPQPPTPEAGEQEVIGGAT